MRYVSRVKWINPGKGVHLGVVAIKKGAFGSPSTTVANFNTYLFILFFKFEQTPSRIFAPFAAQFFYPVLMKVLVHQGEEPFH